MNYKMKINSSFLVANDKKFSTTELILFLSKISKNKVSIFKFPKKILYFFSLIFFSKASYERLNNSFELDTRKFKKKFNWKDETDD